MTTSAVADKVNDDIRFELLAVSEGNLGDAQHRFGIVAVYVEDRRLNGLRHIRGIDRRSRIVRQGGESDLVVDNHMHSSTGAIRPQLRHLQGLQDDTLAGHCRITVDQDRQNTKATDFFAVLLCSHNSFEDTVDGLKV